ncbi:MAG: hypothetical protein SGPRY_012771 [Prymnesium sp.]
MAEDAFPTVWVESAPAGCVGPLDHAAECEAIRESPAPLAPCSPHEHPASACSWQCYNHFRLCEAFKLMGCKLQHVEELVAHLFSALSARSAGVASQNLHLPKPPALLVSRDDFLRSVYRVLQHLHYSSPESLLHFCVACDVKEQRRCMIILLGGTSGSGKSTLASLLASRFGVTTVLSTDSIRNLLRRTIPPAESPCLHRSTYTAGEVVVDLPADAGRKARVLRGYKMQAQLLRESIERVITSFEKQRQSIIMEGVHLDVSFMLSLLSRHPSIIPFIIYISNEAKHYERFAVRSKYMTLEPKGNRYTEHFDAIRIIQRQLVRQADSCLLPKVDNTNVDRSVATIHTTVLRCLAHTATGASLYDPARKQVAVMNRVFASHHEAAWSSKAMLQVIKAKVEKKELFLRLFGCTQANHAPVGSHESAEGSHFTLPASRHEAREGALDSHSRASNVAIAQPSEPLKACGSLAKPSCVPAYESSHACSHGTPVAREDVTLTAFAAGSSHISSFQHTDLECRATDHKPLGSSAWDMARLSSATPHMSSAFDAVVDHLTLDEDDDSNAVSDDDEDEEGHRRARLSKSPSEADSAPTTSRLHGLTRSITRSVTSLMSAEEDSSTAADAEAADVEAAESLCDVEEEFPLERRAVGGGGARREAPEAHSESVSHSLRNGAFWQRRHDPG